MKATSLPEMSNFDGPIWLRLPKKGSRCKITGLSRTTLTELCVPSRVNQFKPPVRSVVVKQPHAQRGIRLIFAASLLAHLENQTAA